MSPTVRPATPTDSAALARIQVDSYRSAYAGLLPQPYLDRFDYNEQARDWSDLLSAVELPLLWVAEDKATAVLGYAMARVGVTTIGSNAYDAELVSLHVRRDRQRQGVGRALIRAAVDELMNRNCRSLFLWTLAGNPNRTIYEGLGGRLVGEQVVELDDDVRAVEVAYGWDDISRLA